jgi:hypothetical protein
MIGNIRFTKRQLAALFISIILCVIVETILFILKWLVCCLFWQPLTKLSKTGESCKPRFEIS